MPITQQTQATSKSINKPTYFIHNVSFGEYDATAFLQASLIFVFAV